MLNKWLLILVMLFCACQPPPPGDPGDDPPNPPDSLKTFSGTVFWDPNPPSDSVLFYGVYRGTQTREYTSKAETQDTSMTFDDLLQDFTYYFAVTATNRHGESGFSEEVFLEGDQVPPDTTDPPNPTVKDTVYARDIQFVPLAFKEFWGDPPVLLNDQVIEVDKEQTVTIEFNVVNLVGVKIACLDGEGGTEIINIEHKQIFLEANTDDPVIREIQIDWTGQLNIELIAPERERLRVHYFVFETE